MLIYCGLDNAASRTGSRQRPPPVQNCLSTNFVPCLEHFSMDLTENHFISRMLSFLAGTCLPSRSLAAVVHYRLFKICCLETDVVPLSALRQLSRNETYLQSHCLATGLYATIHAGKNEDGILEDPVWDGRETFLKLGMGPDWFKPCKEEDNKLIWHVVNNRAVNKEHRTNTCRRHSN
jgi:hypothetical protein